MKQLLALWGDRHKQKTTALGVLLAILATVGLPAEQMEIAAAIIAQIGVPEEYAEAALQVVAGLVAAVFVLLDGKKLGRGGSDPNTLRMPALTALAATLLLLTLSACAGAVPWNKQNYAGIQYIEVRTGQACQALEILVEGDCTVTVIDGKENGSIDIKTVQADGTTTNIKATDAKAFEGQAQRAGVEKDISSDVTGIVEKAVDEVANLKKVTVSKPDDKEPPE